MGVVSAKTGPSSKGKEQAVIYPHLHQVEQGGLP